MSLESEMRNSTPYKVLDFIQDLRQKCYDEITLFVVEDLIKDESPEIYDFFFSEDEKKRRMEI